VRELGNRARATTPDEAAREGDLVVVAVPLFDYRDLPVEPLRGKIVIDTMNYYPFREGQMPDLDTAKQTSSELAHR
jgi:predicted dinucleotide-binding enzyme